MKNKNIISILFALLFVVNCFVFFSVGATPEPSSTPIETSTTSATDIQPESSSVDATETESTTATQEQITSTAPTTTVPSTSTATAQDPVYTTTTTRVTYQYDEYGYAITSAQSTSKAEETVTEPTTLAKIVKDYGSQYDWVKWVSLFGMIVSVVGLFVINVLYKTK